MSNPTDEITENKQPAARVSGWVKVSLSLLFITTLLFIAACCFGYWQLIDLAKRSQTDQASVAGLQTSYDQLKQMTEKSVELSAKQEQIIADWQAAQKGDLNKWYVAEAQYLVRLANDHLLYTYNVAMALTLLQRADQVLQNLQDAGVTELRRLLAENIAALQQHPPVDITGLYLQFSGLNQQLDQLLLPPSPLKADKKSAKSAEEDMDMSWWQKGMAKSWEALSKIVIIRNNETNMMPLVMPDEKIFLYQNLHAQMESVMWAVLHRDNDVYQAGLTRMRAWIQQYFDQDAPATKTMLENLSTVQKINLQPQTVNVATTLQAFDGYFTNAGAV